MRRKYFRILVLACLLPSSRVFGQDRFLSAMNFSQFKYDSTLTYVEIYTAISPALMTYHTEAKADTSRYVGIAKLHFRFTNMATDSVTVLNDEIPISVSDTASIQRSSRFIGITRLLFEPGVYRSSLYVMFGDSEANRDTADFTLDVKRFPGSTLSLSDIELCSEISNATSGRDLYAKNTLHVVPNPKALYGLGLPVVPYYAEIYGLGKAGDTTQFAVTWNIIDTYGKVVKSKSSVRSGTSTNLVEVGSMNISDLSSGKYALELLVADSVTRETAFTSQYFFVYNPYVKQAPIPAASNIDVISSPFFAMGGEELDNVFHAARYLTSPQQNDLYNKLTTVDAKRAFIAQFWNNENRKAGPGGFNSWPEFDKRYKYVNQKYKTAFKAGWITDRGRVYIEYGPPDDIDRHPSTSAGKPYETWTYNSIEGGVEFVFADLTGFNNYVLVHSTKQGEVDDPDWQKYVQPDQ